MGDLFLRRTLAGWSAADADSDAITRKFKAGDVVKVKVSRKRNYRHHCLFMCLLELTYDNLPERLANLWPNPRAFRRAVALEAGHCEEFASSDGEIVRYPLPYDYDHLPDEGDFTVEFGRAMSVCARFIGTSNDELSAEISRYALERHGVAA